MTVYFKSKALRRFTRDSGGNITGLEPIRVQEQMHYSELGANAIFGYDTAFDTENDVNQSLERYPSIISRLFNGAISYFSRRIWGMKR